MVNLMIIFLQFIPAVYGDSLDVSDLTCKQLKAYNLHCARLSDKYSQFYIVDGIPVGEGFNIMNELNACRKIHSSKAQTYFKIHSGLTWYSLLVLAGGSTAVLGMMGLQMDTSNPPDYSNPIKYTVLGMTTVPLALSFRLLYLRKAFIRYNKDLIRYVRTNEAFNE